MTSLFSDESKKHKGKPEYFNHSNLPDGGEARIRILTPAVSGWVNWSDDRKPFRYKLNKAPKTLPNPKNPLKKFHALLVWNYDLNRLQVWTFEQALIEKALESLAINKGSSLNYDIFISRHGVEKDTRYILRPSTPHKLEAQIQIALNETPFNLEALYVGKEPFKDLDAGKEEPYDFSTVA